MACDSLWFLDSILYMICWIRGTARLYFPDLGMIEEIPIMASEELPIADEPSKARKRPKHKSLANIVTHPHYTYIPPSPHHRGYFHPQKKRRLVKKVVANKRTKKKSKEHRAHLPV
jgi:hypothetical protein